jgi:hypothetical protein
LRSTRIEGSGRKSYRNYVFENNGLRDCHPQDELEKTFAAKNTYSTPEEKLNVVKWRNLWPPDGPTLYLKSQ